MSSHHTTYGVSRLRTKTARDAIIQSMSEDFNLMPIVAEAYFNQICSYFTEHANVELRTGQICYEAVADSEPAGKHIALAKKVSVRLTLHHPLTDMDVLVEGGLMGLRRHRILRITREAQDQRAALSYEDIAAILTTSPITVRRDVQWLRRQGHFVITRGWKKDMGPGVSHKTQIIDLYLKGYTFTEIEHKTNHSETSLTRYLRDFTQVVTLHRQRFSPAQIRQITSLSDRLVKEYLDLYQHYSATPNDRLNLLVDPQPGKKGGKQR